MRTADITTFTCRLSWNLLELHGLSRPVQGWLYLWHYVPSFNYGNIQFRSETPKERNIWETKRPMREQTTQVTEGDVNWILVTNTDLKCYLTPTALNVKLSPSSTAILEVNSYTTSQRDFLSLTFWRRIFFFQIIAHPVFKMWVIQKPNKVALWNKRHFEEKKWRLYKMFKIFSTDISWINMKWDI